METERLNLNGAWTEVLANGGTCLIKSATKAILVRITQDASPAANAAGLHYEPHQTMDGLNFNNLPAGTKLFVRVYAGAANLDVVR